MRWNTLESNTSPSHSGTGPYKHMALPRRLRPCCGFSIPRHMHSRRARRSLLLFPQDRPKAPKSTSTSELPEVLRTTRQHRSHVLAVSSVYRIEPGGVATRHVDGRTHAGRLTTGDRRSRMSLGGILAGSATTMHRTGASRADRLPSCHILILVCPSTRYSHRCAATFRPSRFPLRPRVVHIPHRPRQSGRPPRGDVGARTGAAE